jgi:putative exporter of polyketide antibiotics
LVLTLTPFHHVSLVSAEDIDVASSAIMLRVSAAGVAIGAIAVVWRDLRGYQRPG